MKKDYKPYCVVDAENRYKTLVLASKENGQEEIQYYKLAEGERLLDCPRRPLMQAQMDRDGVGRIRHSRGNRGLEEGKLWT